MAATSPHTARSYVRPGILVCADCQTPLGHSPIAVLLSLAGYLVSSFVLPMSLICLIFSILLLFGSLFMLSLVALVAGTAFAGVGCLMLKASLNGLDLRTPRQMHFCAARGALLDAPPSTLARLLSLGVLSAASFGAYVVAMQVWDRWTLHALHHCDDFGSGVAFFFWAGLSVLYGWTLLRTLKS